MSDLETRYPHVYVIYADGHLEPVRAPVAITTDKIANTYVGGDKIAQDTPAAAQVTALVEEVLESLAYWRSEAAYYDDSYEMTKADKEAFLAPYRTRLAAVLGGRSDG